MIDVWDVQSFDDDLLAKLRANTELIHSYFVTEKKNFLEYTGADRWIPYPSNPYAGAHEDLVACISRKTGVRTIRAWHYTRLTDAEVDIIRQDGLHVCTPATVQQRLKAQVSAGMFSLEIADRLFAASPLHEREQRLGRLGKFWMVSYPVTVDDSGVELLLGNWGGEAVYFWLRDRELEKLVAGIGQPRVLELAVPLKVTGHAYSAASAVVATFGRALGCEPHRKDFDLYAQCALAPNAVIAIHIEGEHNFAALGQGYPAGFRE